MTMNEETKVASIERDKKRISKSYLRNQSSENSQPRHVRDGEASPAQVGGMSQTESFVDRNHYQQRSKQN